MKIWNNEFPELKLTSFSATETGATSLINKYHDVTNAARIYCNNFSLILSRLVLHSLEAIKKLWVRTIVT